MKTILNRTDVVIKSVRCSTVFRCTQFRFSPIEKHANESNPNGIERKRNVKIERDGMVKLNAYMTYNCTVCVCLRVLT